MGTLWCQVRMIGCCIIDYGISLCNIIGGYNDHVDTYRDDVFDYDPDADKWTKVGRLVKGRYNHGMSLVPKETADYCVCA